MLRHGRHRLHRKRRVRKLLEREGAVVHFLVRRGSEGRVDALRQQWGASPAQALPVFGDLTQDKLGVSPQDRRRLEGAIGQFYHLAAVYDLDADADSQLRVNVQGTRNAVEFARALGAAHFHHVSSIAAAHTTFRMFPESAAAAGRQGERGEDGKPQLRRRRLRCSRCCAASTSERRTGVGASPAPAIRGVRSAGSRSLRRASRLRPRPL